VKSKKYFYVLRPVLACDWIKTRNSFPPMAFQKLVDLQVTDEKLKTEIAELLKRKIAGEELKKEPKIEILNEFLEEKIEFYKTYVEQIEQGEKPPTEVLDELFKETIYEVWK
jgi:predicted nucleotidyltransferase